MLSPPARLMLIVHHVGRVLAGSRVQVGLAHDPLDVRAGEQQAREERHLVARVRGDRHPGHQRLEQRLRVDVDPRRSLVLVGKAEHDDRADDGGEPREGEADPPTLPHASAEGE